MVWEILIPSCVGDSFEFTKKAGDDMRGKASCKNQPT